MILELIKKIFKYQLFNDIEYGDIISAKRYNNKKEFLNIPKGHQNGPYIVINKTKRKLYCISGSGNCVKDQEFNYEINSLYYNLKKTTYFSLLNIKTINKNTYLNKIDKLIEEDKNRLTKKILYLKNKNYCEDIKLKNISYKLSVGDIIKVYNKFYLIIDITNKIVCFNLKYKDKITINDIKYKKISYIEKDSSIKYINSSNDILLKFALKKYENLLYIKNEHAIPPRGSIIEYNKNYYYIYGSEGRSLLVILIILNAKKKYRQIKLTNKRIYTNFEEHKIDKNNEFHIVEILNNKDIDIIKNIRKNYKKNNKSPNIKKILNNKELKNGSIIKIQDNNIETFIITNIIGNIIECQSTIDKGVNKLYFSKDNVKLVK